MALERANPLPIGRYWVDVPHLGGKEVAFQKWIDGNRDSVRVVTTEQRAVDPDTWGTPAIDWYLFEVLKPVNWDGPGLPTIAAGVTSRDETVQRPDPEKDPADMIPNPLDGIPELPSGGTIVGILGVLGGVYLAWKLRQK